MRGLALKTLFLICLLVPLAALAGDESVGTTSANFLKIAPHARPAAMGEAYSSLSDDEAANMYNPAGIARIDQNDFSATHIEWFQGIRLEHLGGVMNFGQMGAWGASVTWLQVDDIVRTQRTGTTGDPASQFVELGNFSPHDMALNVSYAKPLNPHLMAGGRLNVIQQNIDNSNGFGVSLDAGLQYLNLFQGFDLGAVVHQLGSQVKVGDTPYAMPLIVNVGASYSPFQKQVRVLYESNLATDNAVQSGVGVEGWFWDTMALRGGYKFGYLNGYTLGMGFKVEALKLDYAFIPYGELGNTQRLTVSYVFGAPPVSLSTDLALFSPQGDHIFHTTHLIPHVPGRETMSSWYLWINDSKKVRVRRFEGSGPVPDALRWDGKDDAGRLLADGRYSAELRANFPGRRAYSELVQLEIDNTAPANDLDVDPKGINPDPVTGDITTVSHFWPRATDLHGVDGWKIEMKDSSGNLFRTFVGEGPVPAKVDWDGTDGDGVYAPSGELRSTLRVRDTLGNWSQSKPATQVVLLREVKLKIESKAFFDTGKAIIREGSHEGLARLAEVIRTHQQPGKVTLITGHTDNRPIKTKLYKNNMELSLGRANAIAKYLVKHFGIKAESLVTEGKGDTEPVADNTLPEGRQANRRVEIILRATEFKR